MSNTGWVESRPAVQMGWIRVAVRGAVRTESCLIFATAREFIAEDPRTQHISLAKMYRRI